MTTRITGYEHDIFISYSHLDNLKIFDAKRGWIEEFYDDLRCLLSIKMGKNDAIKIWWDDGKLDGSMLFGPAIEDGIKKSGILLCLNSRGYLNSKYCKDELNLFYEKSVGEPLGLIVGSRSRILNVLLYNIPFTEWPAQFGGTTGFHFHGKFDEGTEGYPFEINSQDYKNELQNLAEIITKMVKEFPKKNIDPDPEEPPVGKGFKIYFGEVAESLHKQKMKTIGELGKLCFEIVTDIPPPIDSAGHEDAVKKELNAADLSVHLLDEEAGKKIAGEEMIGYPQKQVELSLLCNISKLIWVPPAIDISGIKEEKYKGFVQDLLIGKNFSSKISFIRGSESNLTGQIIALTEQIRAEKQIQVKEETAVLLDTHYIDQLYALDLYKCLLDKQIQPFLNPQSDDPRKNINILEDSIPQVSKIIFFYGKVALDWVLQRIIAARQLIINNKYPDKEFYVYMVPPFKNADVITNRPEMLRVKVINNSGPGMNPLNPCFEVIKNSHDQ